ncbi:MAG: Gfo/Idh/MocA family oxidoreductase [Lentisphaeria bacterium]
MLKVAIGGIGGIGNTHARCYIENKQIAVAAVCACIAERADAAANTYGAKAFYSVQKMLDSNVTIDAESIATVGKENGGDHCCFDFFRPTGTIRLPAMSRCGSCQST